MKIFLVSEDRYTHPEPSIAKSQYVQNILVEDQLLVDALSTYGIYAERVSWSDTNIDWSNSNAVVLRTTWDYFEAANRFQSWLLKIKDHCLLINEFETLVWNMNKSYLFDLEKNGCPIVPTLQIQLGINSEQLKQVLDWSTHSEWIIKPNISGAARHTYRLNESNFSKHLDTICTLSQVEALLLQPMQMAILSEGEVSLMLFGGQYSHAIRKRAKSGDFRVQDDHGGTVENYLATAQEIKVAEAAIKSLKFLPAYARVDLVNGDKGQPQIMELELIEPELFLRFDPKSAHCFATAIIQKLYR